MGTWAHLLYPRVLVPEYTGRRIEISACFHECTERRIEISASFSWVHWGANWNICIFLTSALRGELKYLHLFHEYTERRIRRSVNSLSTERRNSPLSGCFNYIFNLHDEILNLLKAPTKKAKLTQRWSQLTQRWSRLTQWWSRLTQRQSRLSQWWFQLTQQRSPRTRTMVLVTRWWPYRLIWLNYMLKRL